MNNNEIIWSSLRAIKSYKMTLSAVRRFFKLLQIPYEFYQLAFFSFKFFLSIKKPTLRKATVLTLKKVGKERGGPVEDEALVFSDF